MNVPKKKKNFSKSLAKGSASLLISSAIMTSWVDAWYTLSQNPSLPYPSNAQANAWAGHTNSVTNQMVQLDSATCTHASGIVNGHFSISPSVNATYQVYDLTNTHSSHSSHSSHCSCSRWM